MAIEGLVMLFFFPSRVQKKNLQLIPFTVLLVAICTPGIEDIIDAWYLSH
jgi:hypothetical protein